MKTRNRPKDLIANIVNAAGTLGRAARPVAFGAALALPLAIAQPASAQYYYDDYEMDDHYEWEADEGWHEEEWYDPSDWFDDEAYNYEYDYYDTYDYYDDDDSYGYDYGNDYGYDYDYYDTYGYDYDEYGDDGSDYYDTTRYGTNYDDSWYDAYDSPYDYDYYNTYGYDDGYDYGYYDDYGTDTYDYNPDYYVISQQDRQARQQGNRANTQRQNQMRNQQGQRQMRNRGQTRPQGQQYRQRDRQQMQDRQRQYRQPAGMRSNQRNMSQRNTGQRTMGQRDMRRSDRMGGQYGAQKVSRSGTVQSIAGVQTDQRPDDHTVLRITMQGGRTVTADLGPNMGRQELPFAQGDRVTLMGDKKWSQEGREVLVVNKIDLGQRTVTLRGQKQEGSMTRDASYRDTQQRRSAQRQGQTREGWSGQSNLQRSRDIALTGNLRNIQRLGQSQDLQILRVNVDGRTRVVAATQDQASRLRDSSGDRVRLIGKWDEVNGREVLKLDTLRKPN